jgi:hypothetical protein
MNANLTDHEKLNPNLHPKGAIAVVDLFIPEL